MNLDFELHGFYPNLRSHTGETKIGGEK